MTRKVARIDAINTSDTLLSLEFDSYTEAKLEYVGYRLLPWIVSVELYDVTQEPPTLLQSSKAPQQ